MRWIRAALLGSFLLGYHHHALVAAELTFTVEATRDGVPVPQSEIKLVPFEFGRSRNGRGSPPPHGQGQGTQGHHDNRRKSKTRRANAQVDSANWCGSVSSTPSNRQIKDIHGYFQHPECSKRAGVTTYPQAAAAWVGIDGDTASTSLLQSGTVCKVGVFLTEFRLMAAGGLLDVELMNDFLNHRLTILPASSSLFLAVYTKEFPANV